ncbi:two-component sensor histidine kinase (plasmid) [Azospirillum sp. B510]|uniref:ATP-binding protein n=1 Tax=Azospirillum sp. (strain B510) TaxID=137722 RepID=UPI0001C4C906|nr:ATP-binding protein [Azospirillum sp. B510]BAI76201.1 two-component sensor histidine kinase [Azospirillum sp. B510]
MPVNRSRLLSLLLAALVYLALKALLYRVAGLFDVAPNASAWYPPIGLMLAFALHSGWAAIPFLFVPSDLLAYGVINSFSLLIIPQAIIVGATGLVLRRWFASDVFSTSKGVGTFITVALISVSALFVISTATVQVITARHISITDNINFAYWLGDMSGVLLCTPVFLALFHLFNRQPTWKSTSWLPLTASTLMRSAGLAAAALLIWFLLRNLLSSPASSFFLLILPIAVAGFLWGFGASTLTAFLVNLGLVLLVRGVLDTRDVVDLQVFMLAAGATGLLLGALGSTRMELLGRNAHLVRAIEEAPLGIALLQHQPAKLNVVFANPIFLRFIPDATTILQRLQQIHEFEGDVPTSERMLHWTIKPASASPQGETLIAIVRDVTEQRRREHAEQHQRRMVAIGEIAGGMAHELNNLLHPIINLSQQARKDAIAKPERLGKALSIIEESARGSAQLVRQVLSFARNDEEIGGGTELVAALRDSIALLTSTLPPTFTITLTHDVPSALVNLTRTEISQIVTNLVVNALDATDQRGRLTIHVGQLVDGSVTATFEDNGPGISAEDAERIMEPFFTTKPHGRGTGLGLAVVRDLLLRRNGSIKLVTQAPQGACFVLSIQSTAE